MCHDISTTIFIVVCDVFFAWWFVSSCRKHGTTRIYINDGEAAPGKTMKPRSRGRPAKGQKPKPIHKRLCLREDILGGERGVRS